MPTDAIPLSEVKRVLVIKLRHHGDVLLTSPVLSVLKNHIPHAEIDALVYHDTREMLQFHPALSHLHTIDRAWKKMGAFAQLKHELALFSELKVRQYDLVVHLTDHKRGGWLCRLLKPKWAVAPAVKWPKPLKKAFSHFYFVVGGNRRHTVDIHLDALRRIGIFPRANEQRMTLVPGTHADTKIMAKLRQFGLEKKKYIAIHPTSRWFFKCWPVAAMAKLINRLHAQGHEIVLTAAPSSADLDYVKALEKLLDKPVHSLAGQLNLKELSCVIEHAKLFVGVDSVPMHMAAAMQTPCVALFGPSGDIEWGPWQVRHVLVKNDQFPCRPCGRNGCGGSSRSECLESISVETVFQACSRLLSKEKEDKPCPV